MLGVQVEYCFTGEGSDAAPAAVSLRGLDAGIYYRSGSLLNCGHAAVRTLIVDSLRHWAMEYDVDGFCFVNAETMAQGAHSCNVPATNLARSENTWVQHDLLLKAARWSYLAP